MANMERGMKVSDEMAELVIRDYARLTAISSITRSRILRMKAALEAAFAHVADIEQKDGWIEWRGGKRPVPPLTIVNARNFEGFEYTNYRACELFWGHYDDKNNIIAYRIIREEKEESFLPPIGSTLHMKDGPYKVMGHYPEKEEKPTKRKQTLLEYISKDQEVTKELVFTDRDDYTRWLVGKISEYFENIIPEYL